MKEESVLLPYVLLAKLVLIATKKEEFQSHQLSFIGNAHPGHLFGKKEIWSLCVSQE